MARNLGEMLEEIMEETKSERIKMGNAVARNAEFVKRQTAPNTSRKIFGGRQLVIDAMEEPILWAKSLTMPLI